MKKLIYFTMLLGIISCKKDLLNNNGGSSSNSGNPTTNNPGDTGGSQTDDGKTVKILRVEQTTSPNSFPFDIDQLMDVNYTYTDGLLSNISVKRGTRIYTYPNQSLDSDNYNLKLDSDPVLINSGLVFSSATLKISDGKISNVVNNFVIDIFGMGGPESKKNFNYHYNDSGVLTQIKSTGLISNKKTLELQTQNYSNGLLTDYTVKNYVQDYNIIPTVGQDYKIQATYQKADGVPTDLVRKVNQAILGVSPIGLEDYAFHMYYDIEPSSPIVESDISHTIKYEKYNYTFADWIFSLGLVDAYSIPVQGDQLIASKHITGKKVINGKMNNNDILVQAKFQQIDSTAQYTYTHNAEEKVLEIAGLRIYYDWSDAEGNTNETEEPVEPETGVFVDSRDGEVYKTVKIGNQTYMVC
ncbi:MAG: hypothetical protein M9887_02885 [Chitinophagales bacterium]|nr:hypothetical protein [Chitinophagales bacterium]